MSRLREHAVSIWQAGVDAVDSATLVQNNVRLSGEELIICGQPVSLRTARRIEVVGAGKAGVGMVHGLQQALANLPSSITLQGWVNVPEDCLPADHLPGDCLPGDCLPADHLPADHLPGDSLPSDRLPGDGLPSKAAASGIHLYGARPAGINEPTAAGQAGAQEILRRVADLEPDDVCLVLISGGGSALLPAPVRAITLENKLTVTRVLAAAATPIEDLNLVRRELSRIKGGGLLRHCRAETVVGLIVSDVIGDPLPDIASGPTVPTTRQPQRALDVLRRCDPNQSRISSRVFDWLNEQIARPADARVPNSPSVSNHIIGSNAVALAAAERRATELGYQVERLGSENCGSASAHGCRLLKTLQQHRAESPSQPVCVLAGGETTVELAPTNAPRKGGRNQETVLAAVETCPAPHQWEGLALLSGGTDGEDGPTDAAGAVADRELVQRYQQSGLKAADYLAINNSYPFFDQLQGLLRTGPTHTNVMDVAVGLVAPDTP